MMRKVSQIITIGVVSFFLCACFKKTEIKTIHPIRGTIQYSFTELARTRLDNLYELNIPIAGQLERIDLEPGDKVKKGQLLARLIQLPLREEVKKAEAQVEKTKVYYENEKMRLKRREKLGAGGYVTKSDLDDIRAEKRVFFSQLAEDAARLEIAKYHLSKSTLYSPIDGVVLERYTQGGKWLSAGAPLLQVGDLNELEVISEVLTQEAQFLQIGTLVKLTSIGSPMVLKGRVKRIDPAGFTKKSSLGVDEQRVNVITTIEKAKAAHLGVGFRLQAEFLVGSPSKEALLVPRFSVLQDTQGNDYVFIVKEGKLHKQIVELGISSDERSEVKKGLTTHDTIVAQPTAEMHQGMRV